MRTIRKPVKGVNNVLELYNSEDSQSSGKRRGDPVEKISHSELLEISHIHGNNMDFNERHTPFGLGQFIIELRQDPVQPHSAVRKILFSKIDLQRQ